jgi:broad specificity phosphatase PhoE
MGRIYLIRHPATQVEAARPSQEWDLSEAGRRQLEQLLRAPWWPSVRHVYASTERKAGIVAEAASERSDLPYSRHRELAELGRPPGLYADYAEQIAYALQYPGAARPGWETVRSAQERIWSFLQAVVAVGPLPAVVVSHGIILTALRAALLHQEPPDAATWRDLAFASVAEVKTEDWALVKDFAVAARG